MGFGLVWTARAVLRSGRNMSTVAVSSAATARSLNDCGQLDSAVTAKRVPQLTPAAPSASAAASCLPVATPPLQAYGALSYQLLTSYLPATTSYLLATYQLLTRYLPATYQQLARYLLATYSPRTRYSLATDCFLPTCRCTAHGASSRPWPAAQSCPRRPRPGGPRTCSDSGRPLEQALQV